MSYVVLVAAAATGAAFVAGGVAVARVRGSRVPGSALAVAGALAIASTALGRASDSHAAALIVGLVAVQTAAVGLVTYPTPRRDLPALAALYLIGAAIVLTPAFEIGGVEASGWITAGVLVVSFGHIWWRLEQGVPTEAWAVRWIAGTAGASAFVEAVATFVLEENSTSEWGAGFGILSLAMIPAGAWIGLARPKVMDVRGLVVGFVVRVTAALAVVTMMMLVGSFLEILGDEPPGTLALAVVAALCAPAYHPLRKVLGLVADELLFGTRPDPLRAAGRFADQVGDDPAIALAAIRESLVLPFAELRVDGAAVATSGEPVDHTRIVPLGYGGQSVGELVVGLRPGDLGLTRNDEQVLHLAAPLLAQTLRARAFAASLQESRELAATAREEERRRLRRDLHDGLGPRLSGLAFTADAAKNTLRSDPDGAEQLLSSVRTEAVTAIREIRELVYGMRPPALDELGLVAALRLQSGALRTPDNQPLRVTVEATELPALSAATEVAAYRITFEALTNAARHSGADTATANLRADDGMLVIEVHDAGRSSAPWAAGVGLSSMRERAAELGGDLYAAGGGSGGVVRATLPLAP